MPKHADWFDLAQQYGPVCHCCECTNRLPTFIKCLFFHLLTNYQVRREGVID